MKNRDQRSKERLMQVIESLDKITTYTTGMAEVEFMQNSMCNEAVLFQLFVIGEAIAHIPNDILKKYPYPWHSVKAQRNMIAHEYFGIRMDMIWSVVVNHLPELRKMVVKIIEEEY